MSRVKLATELTKMSSYYDEWDWRKRVIAYAETVFTKPDNLYLINSQKYTGINRYTNGRWWRWENSSVQGLRRSKNGNVIAYTVVGKKNTTNNSVWALLESSGFPDKETRATFKQYAKDMFGITHWHDVYPVAKHFGIPQYYMVPPTLLTAMRSTSSREFVERVFGKRQYRKDLLKATGNSETIYPLHIAQAFRGLVPTDWIVNFLNLEHDIHVDYANDYGISVFKDIRPFVARIDPRSYRRLLSEPLSTNGLYELEDTIRTFERHGLPNEGDNYFRSWQDIHDRLMPRHAYSYSAPFQDCEIPLFPIAERVHGLTTKSFEIKAATHTTELTEWGNAMHNCIGGYRSMAVDGRSILGAVYSNGKLTANFEIAPSGNLKQLLGPCNKPLGTAARDELEAAFKAKGVKVQGYWGRNDNIF